MKWWEKPLRISAVQCNYGEDSFDILYFRLAAIDLEKR